MKTPFTDPSPDSGACFLSVTPPALCEHLRKDFGCGWRVTEHRRHRKVHVGLVEVLGAESSWDAAQVLLQERLNQHAERADKHRKEIERRKADLQPGRWPPWRYWFCPLTRKRRLASLVRFARFAPPPFVEAAPVTLEERNMAQLLPPFSLHAGDTVEVVGINSEGLPEVETCPLAAVRAYDPGSFLRATEKADPGYIELHCQALLPTGKVLSFSVIRSQVDTHSARYRVFLSRDAAQKWMARQLQAVPHDL